MSTNFLQPRIFGINPYQFVSENDFHPQPRTIPMILNNLEIGFAEITHDPKNNSRMLICVFFDELDAKKLHEGEIEYTLNPQKTITGGREMFFFETIDFFEKNKK